MSKQYKLKGINDETDTCEACGKTNLKRVAWLVVLDNEGNECGDAFAVGMDCAGRMLSWGRKTRQNIEIANDFDKLVAKAKLATERHGKAAVIDWLRRLHWNRFGNTEPTEQTLTLYAKIEGVNISAVIW